MISSSVVSISSDSICWSCRRRWIGVSRTFAQRVLEVDRDAVLFQHVGKSLVRQFLDRRHPVAAELLQLGEGIFVEFDQLAQLVILALAAQRTLIKSPGRKSFREPASCVSVKPQNGGVR